MGEWEKSVFEVVFNRYESIFFFGLLNVISDRFSSFEVFGTELKWPGCCAPHIQTNITANGSKRNVFAFNSRPLRLCEHATVPLLLIVFESLAVF